jgi:hypothetical protein
MGDVSSMGAMPEEQENKGRRRAKSDKKEKNRFIVFLLWNHYLYSTEGFSLCQLTFF